MNSGNTVFTLSVVGGTGVVTLTQFQSVDHSHTDTYSGSYINDVISLTAGKIVLAASAFTTDSEGDLSVVATAVFDLGGHVTFGDDGPQAPTVTLSGETEPVLLTFDGGLTGGNFVGTQDAADTNPSAVIATENFSGAFTIGNQNLYGADGAGATHISYALGFAGAFTAGSASGLTHLRQRDLSVRHQRCDRRLDREHAGRGDRRQYGIHAERCQRHGRCDADAV